MWWRNLCYSSLYLCWLFPVSTINMEIDGANVDPLHLHSLGKSQLLWSLMVWNGLCLEYISCVLLIQTDNRYAFLMDLVVLILLMHKPFERFKCWRYCFDLWLTMFTTNASHNRQLFYCKMDMHPNLVLYYRFIYQTFLTGGFWDKDMKEIYAIISNFNCLMGEMCQALSKTFAILLSYTGTYHISIIAVSYSDIMH